MFVSFIETATTEIYTLSLHDALPISVDPSSAKDTVVVTEPGYPVPARGAAFAGARIESLPLLKEKDRKSTRLNSSHSSISYAVFCLKKKIHPNFLNTIISYFFHTTHV